MLRSGKIPAQISNIDAEQTEEWRKMRRVYKDMCTLCIC